MTELDKDRPRPASDPSTAISGLLVRTFVEYLGRGPTRARTTITTDLITVVLEGGLTRAEKALVDGGHASDVIDTRRSFQKLMGADLIRGVEEITGRQVVAFLSDNHIDPDIALESFVLRPVGEELPSALVPSVASRSPSR